VQIRNYPINVLFAQNGPIYSGKYDLEWTVETNGPDPDNSGSWNGAFIPPHGANTSWLNDPIVNQTSIAALRTFDPAARKAIYQREEERLRQLMPAVVFYWENSYTATNSDLKTTNGRIHRRHLERMGVADLSAVRASAQRIGRRDAALRTHANRRSQLEHVCARGNLQFRLLRAHEPATPFVDLAQWHASGRRSHSQEGHGLRVETDTITSDMPFDGIELRADGVDFNLLAFSSPGVHRRRCRMRGTP